MKEAEAIFEEIFSDKLILPNFDEELKERFDYAKDQAEDNYKKNSIGEEKDSIFLDLMISLNSKFE